jgi:hypothetical protein
VRLARGIQPARRHPRRRQRQARPRNLVPVHPAPAVGQCPASDLARWPRPAFLQAPLVRRYERSRARAAGPHSPAGRHRASSAPASTSASIIGIEGEGAARARRRTSSTRACLRSKVAPRTPLEHGSRPGCMGRVMVTDTKAALDPFLGRAAIPRTSLPAARTARPEPTNGANADCVRAETLLPQGVSGET